MTLFRGKFRKNSIRRPKVNYSSAGYYFVTICIKGRNHYFGEIHEHKMILTKAGEIVWECWLRRYHDHIIRDDVERILIDRYIRDNPRRYGGSLP